MSFINVLNDIMRQINTVVSQVAQPVEQVARTTPASRAASAVLSTSSSSSSSVKSDTTSRVIKNHTSSSSSSSSADLEVSDEEADAIAIALSQSLANEQASSANDLPIDVLGLIANYAADTEGDFYDYCNLVPFLGYLTDKAAEKVVTALAGKSQVIDTNRAVSLLLRKYYQGPNAAPEVVQRILATPAIRLGVTRLELTVFSMNAVQFESILNEARQFPNLHFLGIGGQNRGVVDRHIELLVQYLPQIKQLSFYNSNQITDKAIDSLLQLSQPTNINLDGCGLITQGAKEKLRAKFGPTVVN